jgi:hypothetical protein
MQSGGPGEPGVALLAGVRGENSPHYTKRPPERKNAITKYLLEQVLLCFQMGCANALTIEGEPTCVGTLLATELLNL